MKKAVNLCVSLFLLASMLMAGCNTEGPSGTVSGDVLSSSAESSTQSEEPMVISIANIDDGTYDNDPLIEYVENKLNIEIDFIPLSWSDYEEKANTLIATDSHPDLTMTLGWDRPSMLIKWYNQGMIRSLPDDLSAYPRLKEQLEQFPGQMYDGKYLGITRAANLDPANRYQDVGLYYRKDIYEQYGVEAPATLQEYYEGGKELVEKLKADGISTYLLSSNKDQEFWNLFIVPYKIHPNGYVLETEGDYAGKWVPAGMTSQYWKALELLQTMYTEGLLDPECVSITEDEKVDKYMTGKALTIPQNGIFGWYKIMQDRWTSTNKDKDFGTYCKQLPNFENPDDGQIYDYRNPNYFAMMVVNANVDEAKMTRILELDEYLLSDECLEMSRYGIEGEHYEKDGDRYVSLLPKSEDGLEQLAKTQFRLHNLCTTVCWGDDYHTDTTDPIYPMWLENFKVRTENVNIVEFGLEYVYGDTIDKTDIKTPLKETVIKFITDNSITSDTARQMYIDRLSGETDLEAYLNELQGFAK